uniref:Neur_chan_LBD domain-containing protein n=1 Tax=Globodera pallida TaxID=36090 RepID=A0A183BL22_GLOPA
MLMVEWERPNGKGRPSMLQRDTQFDQRFPVHNLCSPWSSGKQASDYVWAEPADKLLRLLNEKSNNYNYKYNMFLAPGQMTGRHSTNVSIGIYIESMSTFKAQTMDFEVDMYFVMAWYDRRLAHNCTHPLLVAHKSIAERIWTPGSMLVIYPDGLVFKTLRIDVTLSCNMDLQLFPFDRQECPMAIQSYAYVESLVNLSWHVDPPYYPITTNPELKLNDMVITGMRFERCTSPYTMFRGNAMLVSISWMTFWLDPRASPARISLTITSLLTLTTMSNGARQDLPQVSYIKAMDIWQTFSQALIFLVLLEYSFVSYFFTRRSFDCSHRSLNSECSRRLQTKQGDGTTTEEANRAAGNELKERGGRRQTKPAEMNNNNNIHAAVRRRCQPTETVQSKSAVSATVPPKMEEAFSTEIGTSSEGKRRRFCRMNNMREEHQMMGRNHSEEGILMGLGMMEEERGEGVPMPPREKGVWDWDEEDGRGAAGSGGRSWRSTGIGTHCQQCQWEDEMRGRAIDRYSRALFPTIFFSFCLAYWLYYWVLMNHE